MKYTVQGTVELNFEVEVDVDVEETDDVVPQIIQRVRDLIWDGRVKYDDPVDNPEIDLIKSEDGELL